MPSRDEVIKQLVKEAVKEYLISEVSVEERKSVFKQGMTEWLDEQAAKFGKLSIRWALAAAFSVVCFLYAKSKGIL